MNVPQPGDPNVGGVDYALNLVLGFVSLLSFT